MNYPDLARDILELFAEHKPGIARSDDLHFRAPSITNQVDAEFRRTRREAAAPSYCKDCGLRVYQDPRGGLPPGRCRPCWLKNESQRTMARRARRALAART